MNKSDSERIATVLENTGYKSASDISEADLIVVNMCSVRQSAVDRVYGLLPKFKKLKEKNSRLKTILTGCILKKDRKEFRKIFDSIWSFRNYFDIPPKCKSKSLAFVPISNGCNNFCSYCVVPYTRGPLVCRNHQEVLKEVKDLAKKGFKEIWLLGQNVNDYHSPSDSLINFAKLLKMVNDIPGDFKILFTSPHPSNFSDELIQVLSSCEKFGKYFNLPVQSGNDKILKKMNRNYTLKEYKNLVRKIRKKIPEIKLSTDVIVGFPGETKKQFQNTVKLFKEIKFDWAYIAKYSPREGTAASQLEDNVPLLEKKRREKILREIIEKKEPVAFLPISASQLRDKKLIVILGPTASGKSELAIKLAKKFSGEIISADSRQIYKGMNIGTGKVTKKEMLSITHHLLDVVSPKRRFTVTQYRKLTLEAISKIFKKEKVPFLCGGTGFYIQAVLDGILIPEVPPDWKLRKNLAKKSAKELFVQLKKLDPKRARTIEKKNPRRLIRAIEIILKTKRPVPILKKKSLPYPVLMIGIKKDKEELKKLIEKRFFKWLKQGFLKEILKLRKLGISWQRIEEFGIHYRIAAQYLQNKITDKEMIENSLIELQNYAKRQMTWFKRNKKIHWVKNYKEAEKLVEKFLK